MRGRIALQKHFVPNVSKVRARFCGSFGSAHASSRRFRPHAQRSGVHGTLAISIVAIACFCLTSCATVSHHQFAEPAAGWQTNTGQLMYRTAKATLIGEAIVRFSKTGDFELTVSKGPGITLLSLRQDAAFAEIKASFTGQHWSGPTAGAPPQLRGWLGLRDQFLRAPNQKTLRYVSDGETFQFRF
jgi:hypothetical protein